MYEDAYRTHAACVLEKVHASREVETHELISGAPKSLIWQTHIAGKFFS